MLPLYIKYDIEYWGRFVYVLDGSGIDYVCASVKCLAKRSTKLVFRKYPHERCCFMEKQGFSFVPALVPLDAEKQDIHWEMEKEFFDGDPATIDLVSAKPDSMEESTNRRFPVLADKLSNIRNWRHVSGFLIAEKSVFVSPQDLWAITKNSFLVDVF